MYKDIVFHFVGVYNPCVICPGLDRGISHFNTTLALLNARYYK